MHPSKAHPSTTKELDSGLVLGFKPVKRDSDGNPINETVISNTPSKINHKSPFSRKLSTPQTGASKFDFKFSSDDLQLSEQAKKLMDNVREDVARIKAQIILDKNAQERKERTADNMQQLNTRKIAQPHGKVSRFSEAHMAEFKKMDSIADHASSFRATPGRFKPVERPLKRKGSKAGLDEPEVKLTPTKLPTTPSHRSGTPMTTSFKRARLVEIEIPSPKRTKIDSKSRSSVTLKDKPPIRSTTFTTPTKTIPAGFSSARAPKTSMLPMSSAVKSFNVPRTPQTDFHPKLKRNIPSLGNLKSILRRHQPLFSNDPLKIAAGTHVASPGFNPQINMANLSGLIFGDGPAQTPSPKKRVEFTSSTKSRYSSAPQSPSPSKVPPSLQEETTSNDVVYPSLPVTTPPKKPSTPTVRYVGDPNITAQPSPFPNLASYPHGISNKKRRRDEVDEDTENVPPTEPQSASERSSKRIKTATTSLKKNTPIPTPQKPRTISNGTPSRNTPSRVAGLAAATPTSVREKSRGVLSLSRLNMLARPKSKG